MSWCYRSVIFCFRMATILTGPENECREVVVRKLMLMVYVFRLETMYVPKITVTRSREHWFTEHAIGSYFSYRVQS